MKISKKVAGVEYAIRDIVSAAREIEQQGKKVDYLNIGDPVQFGYQPPNNVKRALIDSVNNGNNFYTQSEGLPELLDEIAKKENAKGLSIDSKNVLVTRTFSKIYGLAGLRLGSGYSSNEIIDSMYQIKPPFNVNRAALAAGIEAFKDNGWTKKAIDHNTLWSKKIFSILQIPMLHLFL